MSSLLALLADFLLRQLQYTRCCSCFADNPLCAARTLAAWTGGDNSKSISIDHKLPGGRLDGLRKKVGSPDEITGREERLEKVHNKSCKLNFVLKLKCHSHLERGRVEQLCFSGASTCCLLMPVLFTSSTIHLQLLSLLCIINIAFRL